MADLPNKMDIINAALYLDIKYKLDLQMTREDILKKYIEGYNTVNNTKFSTKFAITLCAKDINDTKCNILYKQYK